MSMFSLVAGGLVQRGLAPGSLTAGAGAWISMRDIKRLEALLIFDAGDTEPVISLQQATAIGGTGAKALTIRSLYHNINNAGWVQQPGVNRDNPVASYDLANATTAAGVAVDAGTNAGEAIVEILAQDLDVANGFGFIRMNVAAADKVGAIVYLASEQSYQGPV